MTSKQTQAWASELGSEYTDRNMMTVAQMNEMFVKRYGTSRTSMNFDFVGDLEKSTKILEVGTNIGNQLLCLQDMGFTNLYGIDVSQHAVDASKYRTSNIDIRVGSAQEIPFGDRYFDLVFTSGVLIHINPGDLRKAMKEIYRCSSCYIWGLEYFSLRYEEIPYRGTEETSELLWSGNFLRMYRELFKGLRYVKARSFLCVEDGKETGNRDMMFLLSK